MGVASGRDEVRFKEGLGEVREKGAREQTDVLAGHGGIQNAQKRSSEPQNPLIGCRPVTAATLEPSPH